MVSTPVHLPGYCILEELYSGTRTQVYRGIEEENQRSVVVKLLKHEHPSFSELVQFRNQYTIAKHLNCSHIIQPYSLHPYRNGYALVMEDCGGISLRQYSPNRPLSLEQFFPIALQLVETLHHLHQQRVIHKDLKPANILIHPTSEQIKLIDFSIASLLPRETQEIQNPNVLEGTLAYLSPEQTGRMNRGIDYRSDFYSLGVTFFELLSGQLPFQATEAMELLHCHLAKVPPSVCELKPELPRMVGEIVSKLLAKNAEERYQSSLGLKHDLLQAQQVWQSAAPTGWFALGQQDLCDRFLIAEKLYGREGEVQTLVQAFGRVARGERELMLVAGFSGIGKTAVVNEVHKPIVRWNGYFIKGKYDQFNRNIPLSAFVQAFRDLMSQLLCESDAQLAVWKTQILEAVGENGQVLLEVIPELEQIIGKQAVVPELSGNAAQNRFNLLFQKFIQVFATQEHPLVIFLDDLQWADLASLSLIKLLMSESDRGSLFILGAYRDNEVFPAHPLMLKVEEIAKTATVNTITLAPLSQASINDLIADTLSCPQASALPLTELVYQKAKGNPFFTTQFLKALHDDGLITFDWSAGAWQCDVAQVQSLSLSDDVVEFMSTQLQKLPQTTQRVLQLAACIGNQFDLMTLAIVCEQTLEETAAVLWKALQEGFVIPTSEVYKFYQNSSLVNHHAETQIANDKGQITISYKFLHDRVQQAAYSLIPESQRKAAHLKIGQLLLENTSVAALEANIFDIVNQLNQGIDILTQQLAKEKVAELNLFAGRKAKASTAYNAAVEYFASGIQLLSESSWQSQYKLTFGLYRERAECEYLTGNLDRAESLFNVALSHTQDQFEQADIYAIQMYLKMTQGEIQAGFEAGLKGLSIMGMHLPLSAEEQQVAINIELEKLHTKLKIVRPTDLFDLPQMTDLIKKVCMSLLADLWAAAYMGGHQGLSHLSLLLMINTSLKYGNAEGSGFAYCLYGMSLANQGDYQTAYEFGTLALKLDRHFNSTKFIYKTNNIFAHTINPYNRHLETNLPLSQQSFQTSQEGGDVVFGVWAVSFLIWAMLIKGDCLPDIYAETEKYLSYVQRVNDVNMLYAFTLQQQFILNLQGSAKNTDLLNDQNPDLGNGHDTPYINVWRQKKNFEHGINWYCFLKLQLLYLYGRYTEAIAAAKEAEPTLPANGGFFPIIQYHFYYPLSVAAIYSAATPAEKDQYWIVLQQHQQIVKKWADFCPENFLHRYLLLSAEISRISGKALEASELYDRAITVAKTNEYIHEAALADELAAKFYLDWGKPRIAQEYMTEAYYGYARWGAKDKVADLEDCYPQLLAPILQQPRAALSVNETVFALGTVTSHSSSSSSISDSLDFSAILKTSQTLSSEIELGKLLSALLRTVIQTAGASKCALMLLEDGSLMIRASAELTSADHIAVNISPTPVSVQGSSEVPISLINTVKRNLQPTVIIDATVHPQFAADVYIQSRQPKSILCSPILQQGKLLGLMYLENNLVIGAFTHDRVELFNLLCTQAAISIENARLYEKSQTYAQSLERSLAGQELMFELVCNIRRSLQVNTISTVVTQQVRRILEADRVGIYQFDPTSSYNAGKIVAEDVSPEFSSAMQINVIDHCFGERYAELYRQGRVYVLPDLDRAEVQGCYRQMLEQFAVKANLVAPILWRGELWGLLCIHQCRQPRHWTEDEIQFTKQIAAQLSVALEQAKLLSQTHEQAAQLEQSLHNLQQTQMQLVQNEKMSALGSLVAGVAHEINNPVGFIAGNLHPALDYVNDVFRLLDLYRQEYPNPNPVIQEEIEAIDLEYIREDLPKLIGSMQLGVDRIRNISASLRTFSRADKDYKVPFNIHEGIDSTILILKHRLKANDDRPAIEVTTDYGDIPAVECFPGQLNQVFMNILANAIDALEEANQSRSFAALKADPNQIKIQTSLSDCGTEVVVRLQDNGIGMSDAVKSRVFDHLFTTKGVGKGTGLGLAIVQQIVVEKHKGQIDVDSQAGRGTTFTLRLPVKGS